MHLHPARISPHILFVLLNYWPAMTDLYSSLDTRWLSLGSLGFLFPLLPILLSPPFTHLFQFSPPVPSANPPPGIPGALSPTVVFGGPVCCRRGWCGSGAQPCVLLKGAAAQDNNDLQLSTGRSSALLQPDHVWWLCDAVTDLLGYFYLKKMQLNFKDH